MVSDRWNVWALGLLAAATVAPAAAQSCPVFSLRDEKGELAITRHDVPAGELAVWPIGGDGEPIDIVLPVGPGSAGSLAARGQRTLHLLRCTGGAIEHTLRLADGREVPRPPRPLTDLRELEVRVSVVTDDGRRAAFRITGWDEVAIDDGPIQNLLAGVPLPPGLAGAFVTTETRRRVPPMALSGSLPLTVDRHLFARVRVSGGADAWFIVDTGGSQTLVARSFLPTGTEITPAETVEYSAAGRRILDYAPGGATGAVPGILGHAVVRGLACGELLFPDFQMAVIDEMPALFGRPVAGVLGLDLLGAAGGLLLELPSSARGEGRLTLTSPGDPSAEMPGERALAVPLSVVNGHLVVAARVSGVLLHGILDTGAPDIVLDPATAAALGVVAPAAAAALPARGLDGGTVQARTARLPDLTLGRSRQTDLPVVLVALPVLAPLRLPGQHVGLLGNSLLARFARVELDLVGRVARFVPRSTEAGGD